MDVRVCVWARKWLSLNVVFFFFFFSWPAKLAWQQKEILCARFIKTMYYLLSGLKESHFTVFLTAVFHEPLDKNRISIESLDRHVCSVPLRAAEMERGRWRRYEIFILCMFYIMQNYKDHF